MAYYDRNTDKLHDIRNGRGATPVLGIFVWG